jgi:hypothetical protein
MEWWKNVSVSCWVPSSRESFCRSSGSRTTWIQTSMIKSI